MKIRTKILNLSFVNNSKQNKIEVRNGVGDGRQSYSDTQVRM